MAFELNLQSETVADAAPVDPLMVQVGATVGEVLALLKAQNTGSVLVCRDGKLAGIFTERDALSFMTSGRDLTTPIEDLMVSDPATIGVDDTVGQAIKKMAAGGYRRLPIIDQDRRPSGILKVSGIVRYLVEHFPQSVYNLPPSPNQPMETREGA